MFVLFHYSGPSIDFLQTFCASVQLQEEGGGGGGGVPCFDSCPVSGNRVGEESLGSSSCTNQFIAPALFPLNVFRTCAFLPDLVGKEWD